MTRSSVVDTVIRYLGRLAFLLICGALYLTWVVIQQAGKAGPVDPTAVALVGSSWALAGSCSAALATVLVSTKSAPEDPESMPVVVTNAPEDPVQTEEAKK